MKTKDIEIMPINPLQVNKLPNNIEDEDEDYSNTKSALALHMDFLTAFFKLYFPEITSFQMSLLMEILEELYKSFNIDYETDIEKIPKEQFPIMEDLYYLLEKKIENLNTKHKDEIEVIKSKVPQAIEFMRNFSKRCRKYQCGLITISQNILDFLGDEIKQYGQAILDNSTYKFFFGTDGQDLEEIVRIYNLNNEEKTILSQKDRGRGLMFVGPGHSLINVKGEEWEKPYLIGGGK